MEDTPAVTSSRLARKKEETKQKIISVAMTLFKKQGFAATTMEQIAAEVDIAKGTLYNYFPVKEAILDEYVKRAFKERNPERAQRLRHLPDTRARMIMALTELISGVQSQKEIFEQYHTYRVRNMVSLQQDTTVESGIGMVSSEIIVLGQESGEIRKDIPLGILQDLFEFTFIEVAMQFYKDPQHFDAGAAIPPCVDLFLNGASA